MNKEAGAEVHIAQGVPDDGHHDTTLASHATSQTSPTKLRRRCRLTHSAMQASSRAAPHTHTHAYTGTQGPILLHTDE